MKTLSVFAVALHPEGVDRNKIFEDFICCHIVALHPEGVDRNFECQRYKFGLVIVALHPEGVDRNRK